MNYMWIYCIMLMYTDLLTHHIFAAKSALQFTVYLVPVCILRTGAAPYIHW